MYKSRFHMRDKSVFFWPRPLLLLCQVFFFLLREGRTCICHCVNMKVRSPLSRVNSFLPSWGIQGSNPGQQVYAKELPPTEPSHQPNSLFSPLDSAYEKEKKMQLFTSQSGLSGLFVFLVASIFLKMPFHPFHLNTLLLCLCTTFALSSICW